MADISTKLPIKSESRAPAAGRSWYPLESLLRDVDRMFDDLNYGFRRPMFARSLLDYAPFARLSAENGLPVDIAETDGGYEITAELPGIDEKDIDITVTNSSLSIKAEKKEEKEEKSKDYMVCERRYGAFERQFTLPPGVDADKISANFTKGVLTITLPKTPEAQKQEIKIAVKAN